MRAIQNFFLLSYILFVINPVWATADMVTIDGGSYRPLYLKKDTPKSTVETFKLDKYPVTNRQFLEFVRQNPQYSRNKISQREAETGYLRHWHIDKKGQIIPRKNQLNQPVTNVSWFAANAYCRAKGKRLPTIDEWEFVGLASEKAKDGSNEDGYNRIILDWYADGGRRGLRDVGTTKPNIYGVYDMHGLIWEWTEDFNSSLLSSGSADSSLFCGGGTAGSTDPSNYAAFMRYGIRISLQSPFVLNNLGFRCATEN